MTKRKTFLSVLLNFFDYCPYNWNLNISAFNAPEIVKSWTVKDGKVTTHKDEQGAASGYYYFWSVESGYVQVPIIRAIVEEIK